MYSISLHSFRGNYSFLNFEIQRSQYIRPKVTVHKGAETIQGRKLYDSHNGRCLIDITQPFYDSWVWHVWCLSVYCKHEFVFSSPFFISWLHSMLIRLKKSRNIKNFSAVCMDHMYFLGFVNCDIDCRLKQNWCQRAKRASSIFENCISRHISKYTWWL